MKLKKEIIKQISLVLISYKSKEKILNFIKKIPNGIKVIIIENSKDYNLKKKINRKYKNIDIYLRKNNGVSSALNYASKKIKTKYFLQISPDIDLNFNSLNTFHKTAIEINDKFSALGPRFLNVIEKSHKQTNKNIELAKIDSIHGSVMFFNKKNFNRIGKFDENFFLYFEETEYCKRAKLKNLQCYQINKIKVKVKGRSVKLKNNNEKKNLEKLLAWHFIWSKFYFYNKYYGKVLSITYFIPVLIRTFLRIKYYKMVKNVPKYERYKSRLNGLLSSIKGQKSYLRPLKT